MTEKTAAEGMWIVMRARGVLRTAVMLLPVFALGCTPLPHEPGRDAPLAPAVTRTSPVLVPGVPVVQQPSPNIDERRATLVVLHHTSDDTVDEALQTLTRVTSGVSAHYLIDRNGTVYHLVDESRRAWHAGVASWGPQRDINSSSLGIELDNNGHEPFAEPQIASLMSLLADIKARYRLPANAFVGHGDIAPGRKVDPSEYFPWQRLAAAGFGVWCDPPYPAAPAEADTALLLQAFGYNVWNVEAAVAAFKRHFSPGDPTPEMTDKDRSMLYCLVSEQQAAAVAQ